MNITAEDMRRLCIALGGLLSGAATAFLLA
jgi:hypothetical protein